MRQDIFDALRDSDGKPVARNIRIAAALLGPGYKGERGQFDAERRSVLRELWHEAGLGPMPAYSSDETPEYKDRRAKLFEIGEYCDKGLSVSQSDLHKLASNFDLPVPILVEHVENPLRLGYLTHVEAAGPELFGVLAFTPEADELIESSQAKSLSLSVSKDLDEIYEVSIVANPRIESARLFCANFREIAGDNKWKKENARLQKEIETQRIGAMADDLLRFGHITPVQAQTVFDLLTAASAKGFAQEVMAFLRSLPRQVVFGELVPSKLELPGGDVEEIDFYKRHFPEIGVDEILKRKVVR